MDEALPEWVDGPAFIEWLESVRPDYRSRLTDAQKRWAFRLVDERARGGLGPVDAVCVRLDLHINEIPEEVWTDPPNLARKENGRIVAYPPEVKAQALGMLREGIHWKEVSDRYGIPGGTVKNWQTHVRKAA